MRAVSLSPEAFVGEVRSPSASVILAVQHVRRMRGGSQSHLMRCSDGNFYVVKFLNNPQHSRVLANEILASGLAELSGLPVPHTEIVQVDEYLIRSTPELTVKLAKMIVPCQPGLQFGSQYVINPWEGRVLDVFPNEWLNRVRNLGAFAGVLAFDKWTGNVDSRQATFWRRGRQKKYTASFVDQGHCFNIGEWNFPDNPLRGAYPELEVYLSVKGWESFEPWLSRIETIDDLSMRTLGNRIPTGWSGGASEVTILLKALKDRRAVVRDLILAFRFSSANPFPNWTESSAMDTKKVIATGD
jgi:hypothetical protein